MRDPPGDVGPGRLALGGLQLGDIVERHHVAVRPAATQLRPDTQQQRAPPGGRADLDLCSHRLLRGTSTLGQERCKLRHDLTKLQPNRGH